MIGTVGDGDVKKPLKKIAQRDVGTVEQAGNAGGVFLEASDILPGEVVDPGGVFFLVARNIENFAKSGHFVPGYKPVCLGHLRAERDDGDSKGNRTLGRRF